MNTRKLLVSGLMLVSVLVSACAPAATATPAPTAVPTTAVPPSAAPTATPQQTTFQSSIFEVPVSFTYRPGWVVDEWAKNGMDIVKGNSWGASIFLLNGAQVADPGDMTKPMPLPDDFFAYFASLLGAEVIQGPESVTIGGIQGSQVITHTPAMHPFLWLKDDYTWLGGGASGIDPEFKRQMILLEVNGQLVLLEFSNSPNTFDERYPLVQEIFNSITFGK